MGPEDLKLLRETHRLALENNQMLRKMRRGATVRMIIWLVIYAAIIAAPIWLYVTYLDGAVQKMLKAYDAFQGTSSGAAQQYQGMQDAIKDFQTRMGGGATSGSPSQ